MAKPNPTPRLVADIGGTHTRFGLVSAAGRTTRVRTLKCADHESVSAAARTYLDAVRAEPPPREAAFAVAGPIRGDRVRMTNRAWSFTIPEVQHELGLESLEVLNDFAALAWALPFLTEQDSSEIKPGSPAAGEPMAVLGPGTGLGVGVAVLCADRWTALATEGGHRDLAARDDREWRVLSRLRDRFGHVSAERVLSGPGLVNLYETVCSLRGTEPASLSPKAVVDAARSADWPACGEAVDLFTCWLGAVAGDLALTVGARGGVFLAGGILPKMGELFDVRRFGERFLAKGRFREYLQPIPVRLIVHPQPALVGAARFLARAR